MRLAPVASDDKRGSFRVPVKRDGDRHEVFVGDNFVRTFTTDTLPDFIKLRIAMINASGVPEVIGNPEGREISGLAIYLAPHLAEDELLNIGWKVTSNPDMYTVVMSEQELDYLRGDAHK